MKKNRNLDFQLINMLSPVDTAKHTSQLSPTLITSGLAMDVEYYPNSFFPKQTNELAKRKRTEKQKKMQ